MPGKKRKGGKRSLIGGRTTQSLKRLKEGKGNVNDVNLAVKSIVKRGKNWSKIKDLEGKEREFFITKELGEIKGMRTEKGTKKEVLNYVLKINELKEWRNNPERIYEDLKGLNEKQRRALLDIKMQRINNEWKLLSGKELISKRIKEKWIEETILDFENIKWREKKI